MKFIAQILALYFLAIAFLPCHDGQADCATTCSTHISTTNETAGDQHQDACPPLCACSCCGISAVIAIKAVEWGTSIPIKPYHINAFYYDSPKGITHQNNVWHPPKVA